MTAICLGLGGMYAALLFACSLDTPPLLVTDPIATTEAMDRFTPQERSSYLADQQYLHRLVPPGVRVELDLADPRQYRFAMSRLALAGKTSANAPQLFARIAARGGAGSKSRGAGADTASLASQHEIVDVHLGTPAAPNLITATAVASPDAAASYMYLDIAITTVTEVPIGPLQWVEQFGSPDDVLASMAVSVSGDRSAADVDRYVISSFEFEETLDDVIDSYIYLEVGGGRLASPPDTTGNIP